MSDHYALCKLLADVAGVRVILHDGRWIWDNNGDVDTWDPFKDANQMELVKEGLKQIPHTTWQVNYLGDIFGILLWTPDRDGYNAVYKGKHESEAMALALAIEAMKGEG